MFIKFRLGVQKTLNDHSVPSLEAILQYIYQCWIVNENSVEVSLLNFTFGWIPKKNEK